MKKNALHQPACRGRRGGGYRKRYVVSLSAAALLLLGACSGGSSGQETDDGGGASQELTVSIGALDAVFIQPFVAQYEGMFKKNNVDVKLTIGGSNSIAQVVSGQADLAFLGSTSPLVPVKDGKSTTVIYNNLAFGTSGYLVGAKDVVKATDCKKVATTGVGTTSNGWAQLYKQAFHASYDVVPYADYGAMFAAFKSGQANCANGTLAAFQSLLDSGAAHLVVDPFDSKTQAPGVARTGSEGVIWGLTDNLKEKAEAITSFLRAYIAAGKYVDSHSDEELADLLVKNSPDFKTLGTAEALAQKIKNVRVLFNPDKGRIEFVGLGFRAQICRSRRIELRVADGIKVELRSTSGHVLSRQGRARVGGISPAWEMPARVKRA